MSKRESSPFNDISIIVPILNEEKILTTNYDKWVALSSITELIFVDGGSQDQSIEIAKKIGHTLSSQRGRYLQMNHGAKKSSFNQLLFLHADTWISPQDVMHAANELCQKNFIAGCFTLHFSGRGRILRIIEALDNLRSRITKVCYGDRGLLIRRKDFFDLGGFPSVSIMEDVLFSAHLKRKGKITIFPEKIQVSSRRFEKQGPILTLIYYSFLYVLFWLKFPLPWIKNLYGDLR